MFQLSSCRNCLGDQEQCLIFCFRFLSCFTVCVWKRTFPHFVSSFQPKTFNIIICYNSRPRIIITKMSYIIVALLSLALLQHTFDSLLCLTGGHFLWSLFDTVQFGGFKLWSNYFKRWHTLTRNNLGLCFSDTLVYQWKKKQNIFGIKTWLSSLLSVLFYIPSLGFGIFCVLYLKTMCLD